MRYRAHEKEQHTYRKISDREMYKKIRSAKHSHTVFKTHANRSKIELEKFNESYKLLPTKLEENKSLSLCCSH